MTVCETSSANIYFMFVDADTTIYIYKCICYTCYVISSFVTKKVDGQIHHNINA